jgi:hypothetical protein
MIESIACYKIEKINGWTFSQRLHCMTGEARSISVRLPGAESPVSIDNVPIETTFAEFKGSLAAHCNQDFVAYVGKGKSGRIYHDNDKIEEDDLELVIPERPIAPKRDIALPILFWLFHLIPIYVLSRQKTGWQLLNAVILSILLYLFAWYIWKRFFKSIPIVTMPQIITDLWILFRRSLSPSFRVEHLIVQKE